MFKIDMRSNVLEYARRFPEHGRQVVFATAVSLTRTVQDVRQAEYGEMQRRFDRPTQYTMRSLFIEPATVAKLRAKVWLRDVSPKGTPAEKFLGPQIEGGPRRMKGFERLLVRKGLLPTGWMAVPGRAAKLDAYGNMSRGQIVQILSALQAFGEVGYGANRTKSSVKRRGSKLPQYFVGRPGGGRLPRGVWQRFTFAQGSAVKPVLIFVRGPRYRPIFQFFEIAERTANDVFPRHMDREYAKALATAR